MRYLFCMFCHAFSPDMSGHEEVVAISDREGPPHRFVFDESGSYCSVCIWSENNRIADEDHIAEVVIWK